ncbi:MAG: hypothetical protein WCG63_04015 [Opitutaceae bacterium]
MPTAIRKFWDQLPSPTATLLSHFGSLAVGVLAAFILHYVLYRIGLPSKPFIYVAF